MYPVEGSHLHNGRRQRPATELDRNQPNRTFASQTPPCDAIEICEQLQSISSKG